MFGALSIIIEGRSAGLALTADIRVERVEVVVPLLAVQPLTPEPPPGCRGPDRGADRRPGSVFRPGRIAQGVNTTVTISIAQPQPTPYNFERSKNSA